MAQYAIRTANTIVENITDVTGKAIHPYYPLDAYIDGYVANEWSVPALLGVFFGACIALFSFTYFLAKRINSSLNTGELTTIMWFVLSGSIHMLFEGYYAYNYATLGTKQTLIGQMWKEYAFSDSRYLTQDSFVLCMETVTAVCWGPGCFIVAALVMLRSPFRYPLQMLVSMGQFYGDALYYATSFFDHHVMGITYSRPEPFYFYFYFVLMNLFWIVVPGCEYSSRWLSSIPLLTDGVRFDIPKYSANSEGYCNSAAARNLQKDCLKMVGNEGMRMDLGHLKAYW